MLFWLLALAITLIAGVSLYLGAAGRLGFVTAAGGDPTTAHFRSQLGEIERDMASGRMAPTEGVAAKGELAREILRAQREAVGAAGTRPMPVATVPVAIVAVAVLAFATYAYLGSPNLPSEPLATRADAAAQNIKLDDAIKDVETRLASHPEDIRGWQVIAPIYMQSGEYAKAEHAFRQILALGPPTANGEADLAEALMMQNGGAATGEAADLLNRAVAMDSKNVRARFYLAAEAMRAKNYAAAVTQWNDVIALGTDADSWMPTAKAGLAAAEAARDGKPVPGLTAPPAAAETANSPPQSSAILGMVQWIGRSFE